MWARTLFSDLLLLQHRRCCYCNPPDLMGGHPRPAIPEDSPLLPIEISHLVPSRAEGAERRREPMRVGLSRTQLITVCSFIMSFS